MLSKIKKSQILWGTEHFDLPEANTSLWIFFKIYFTYRHIYIFCMDDTIDSHSGQKRFPLFEHVPFLKNFAS